MRDFWGGWNLTVNSKAILGLFIGTIQSELPSQGPFARNALARKFDHVVGELVKTVQSLRRTCVLREFALYIVLDHFFNIFITIMRLLH